jgi:hypothetical protein
VFYGFAVLPKEKVHMPGGMWTKTFRQSLSDDGDGQLLPFVLMYNYKYPMVNV